MADRGRDAWLIPRAAAAVGRGSPVNKNTLVALGVLLVALLIGLLWIFLATNYSGQ